jgi:hypothetical protein
VLRTSTSLYATARKIDSGGAECLISTCEIGRRSSNCPYPSGGFAKLPDRQPGKFASLEQIYLMEQ